MEVEVMVPSPPMDFNFDSACTSPYVGSPSSPQRFGNFFFSAPTSPSRASSFYRELNAFSGGGAASGATSSAIPFDWEDKPGIPKTKVNTSDDNDFEFDFSGQLERTSLSADELFDGGKIKPLKPPPRLQMQINEHGLNDSPKLPRSPISKRIIREALSPRHRKKDFDTFAEAIEQTRREGNEDKQQGDRGRERTHDSSAASLRQKGTRSLSPFRVCDIFFENEINQESSNSSKSAKPKPSHSSSSSFSFSNLGWKGYKKWKLKDLLLFRSASEGRATSKDPLRKYSMLKKNADDMRTSSFRSTESGVSVSSRRRRGPLASAHELHYTANRAVAEEMRKKTVLPYRHGLLGCLGFNPAVQDISRGFNSMTRG